MMQSSALLVSPRRGLNKRASGLDLAVDLDLTCEVCLRSDCPVLAGQTSECPTSWDWEDDAITGERDWAEFLAEQKRKEEGLSARQYYRPWRDDPLGGLWDDDLSPWREPSFAPSYGSYDPDWDDYPDF